MKEDCDVDDLVDVIEGSRVYIPCIYVINKIDQVHAIACMVCLALLNLGSNHAFRVLGYCVPGSLV